MEVVIRREELGPAVEMLMCAIAAAEDGYGKKLGIDVLPMGLDLVEALEQVTKEVVAKWVPSGAVVFEGEI